jgi:RNA polymerase sigma-70 factor (ECF subfamily)
MLLEELGLPALLRGVAPQEKLLLSGETGTGQTRLAGHSGAALVAEDALHECAPRVYSLARRLLDNDADAEDVTQDVFLQVLRKLDTFRGEAAFPTWLHRITVNAALEYREKRARREQGRVPAALADEDEEGHVPSSARHWSVAPDRHLLDRETHELIEGAIAGLPERYRNVYVLADVEGLPNAEIAGLLGLGVPAVKSRLHRARLMLRDALAPHFEERTADRPGPARRAQARQGRPSHPAGAGPTRCV